MTRSATTRTSLSAEEANTWTAIFDEKWKGKSGLNTDPLIALGQAIMAMNTLGLSDVKNPGNPTKEQIDGGDEVPGLQEEGRPVPRALGRFRRARQSDGLGRDGGLRRLAAGGDGGEGAGQARKYAMPKEGYRAWAIGPSLIAGSPNKEAVFAYADYWLSGPPGITVSEQGYYSPTTNIKNVMPPDKYAFWYEGKPWKGAAERGIKEGDLRDGGSLETRAGQCRLLAPVAGRIRLRHPEMGRVPERLKASPDRRGAGVSRRCTAASFSQRPIAERAQRRWIAVVISIFN